MSAKGAHRCHVPATDVVRRDGLRPSRVSSPKQKGLRSGKSPHPSIEKLEGHLSKLPDLMRTVANHFVLTHPVAFSFPPKFYRGCDELDISTCCLSKFSTTQRGNCPVAQYSIAASWHDPASSA